MDLPTAQCGVGPGTVPSVEESDLIQCGVGSGTVWSWTWYSEELDLMQCRVGPGLVRSQT